VLVEIKDTGPGLAPATLERLFDPFYTIKSSGMGMGLSISRSILEDHGGRLFACANVPCGATFHFTLSAVGDAVHPYRNIAAVHRAANTSEMRQRAAMRSHRHFPSTLVSRRDRPRAPTPKVIAHVPPNAIITTSRVGL
jgi:hypothetical protein